MDGVREPSNSECVLSVSEEPAATIFRVKVQTKQRNSIYLISALPPYLITFTFLAGLLIIKWPSLGPSVLTGLCTALPSLPVCDIQFSCSAYTYIVWRRQVPPKHW